MSFTAILLIFLFLLALILVAFSVGWKIVEIQRKQKVSGMFVAAAGPPQQAQAEILEPGRDAEQLSLAQVLARMPLVRALQNRIYEAGMTTAATRLLALTAVLAVLGALIGSRVHTPLFREFAIGGLAVFLGLLPYWHVSAKRRKRMNEFEEQFPEALDFLARSMRAGHAFSVSVELMADESPDPLGFEFRRITREQNLGSPLEVTLRGVAERVPLIDVRFFVAAVLLQRETGGNLAETLTNLAYVIRERFRLKGHIKSASAHGRITAAILTVLPILTALGLMLASPGYVEGMAADPDGRKLLVAAVLGQITGYLVLKKIVNIKV